LFRGRVDKAATRVDDHGRTVEGGSVHIALIDPELAGMLREAQDKVSELLDSCLKDYALEKTQTEFWAVAHSIREIIKRSRGRAQYLSLLKSSLGTLEDAFEKKDRGKVQLELSELLHIHLLGVEQDLEENAARQSGVDRDLLAATDHHLKANHFQDAIRAAFPVLTTRLRSFKRGHQKIDGRKLVNELVGDSRHFAGKWPDDDRLAMRDLLAGLYGVVRNWHAHNAGAASPLEVQGVICLLHHLLTGPLSSKKRKKALRRPRRSPGPSDPTPTRPIAP
jgi:hypothetical protein